MRTLGLQVIKVISLIRYYGLRQGMKIFIQLLFQKKGIYTIQSKIFLNAIKLRKAQSDTFIFEQIFIEQQYNFEHPFPEKVQWIIDAGANIGLAAIYFSIKFPNAKIISIEPNKENFELLKKNTSGYKNVICINAGLWHQQGKLDISNKEQLSAGYMIQEKNDDCAEYINAVTVEQLLKEYNIGTLSIMKIDIEGSEKEIFQYNSSAWLTKTDCVITELHDWLKPGTSKIFFKSMSDFDWITYVKGENIICLKSQIN
ncbi:MAG: FkbM family methyltransferase [Bacteroidetes bacterium]|nr:FkbM family methyltransferase [Bacteroidota bacterium]